MPQVPKFLSPSAFTLYCNDTDLYVKRYISEPRLPREPQTKPMAIGSSFDTFVKNELARCCLPVETVQEGGPFHLETLFNAEVDEEHRGWAWEGGGWMFLQYKDHGAFDALLADMEGCQEGPSFEEELIGELEMPNGIVVPMKGFPDCHYVHRNGIRVLLDWKCNGYMAKSARSPYKHYLIDRPKNKAYKGINPVDENGLVVQRDVAFEEVNRGWATQLAIYLWLLGEPVAKADSVVQIDQVLPRPNEEKPQCRIVTYRGFISREFQARLADKLASVWSAIKEGHVYDSLPPDEGRIKVEKLEQLVRLERSNNPILSVVRHAKGG